MDPKVYSLALGCSFLLVAVVKLLNCHPDEFSWIVSDEISLKTDKIL
jgi:hypothetical protein